MRKLLSISFVALLFFSSCKTDFNINAEWKDITVVYGLLNQNDTVQYIKINKAFLGEGNALTMAANPDSCSYGNNLEVRVEEWLNNTPTGRQWNLETTIINNKEPGVFHYPEQVIYKFDNDTLYEDREYRLVIKNKVTGKIVTSKTPLIHTFGIVAPTSRQPAVFYMDKPYQVKWYSAKNGKLYQVTVRFNYWEKKVGANDSIKKSVDWYIGSVKSESVEGGELMFTEYYGSSFFQYLGSKISHSPPDTIRRVAAPNVEFIFSVAADDFNTYMEVSAPSTGVNEEKPEYTNITNGTGLFSSRFQINRKLAMHPRSLDSLVGGRYTDMLNFIK